MSERLTRRVAKQASKPSAKTLGYPRIAFAGVEPVSRSKKSQTALRAGFSDAGASSEKRRQVRVSERRTIYSRQIGRRLKTRKDGVGNLTSRDALRPVAGRNIARPEADTLHA